MKRTLFVPVAIGVLAGILAIAGCTKNSKNGMGDTVSGGSQPGLPPDSSFVPNWGRNPAAEFIFLHTPINGLPTDTASPNGHTTWFEFDSLTSPAPILSVMKGTTTGIDSFAILYASADPVGGPFPTGVVLPDTTTGFYAGSNPSFPAGSRALIVPMYKATPCTPQTHWVPFDSIWSPNSVSGRWGNVSPGQAGPMTLNFSSTSGAQTASVVIAITSTIVTPVIPPKKK
ncbi:MAG: hypothetical protein Q8922_06140 [Bacteroidota bacterium]|nr:hypothetical protein [Bacteroidota bacterium]MDP4233737.1 hypothetical protein [Bacteroidota bacterium]MDP4242376.1 hypothetical protein [Bacteroidota bacterium]MDP4287498.1 hypothetical protein [Bacteroidota bacterium]